MPLPMLPPLVSAIALTFGLSLLFATLGTSNTAGLPIWQAWLHWLLHIGTGLSLALVVADLCGRSPRLCAMPPTVFVLLTGVLGALCFAPLALWFEGWLPQSEPLDNDPLDRWAALGGLRPVIAEFLALAPSYLLSWFLVNAAPLIAARRPAREGRWTAGSNTAAGRREAPRHPPGPLVPPSAAGRKDGHALIAQSAVEDGPDPASDLAYVPPSDSLQEANSETEAETAAAAQELADAPGIIDRLPRAIGSDLVSASAELHYLEVVTTRGRATLLGKLTQLEREMGALGLRVHRSHWVSLAHVRRVYRSRHGWQCEMRDGRRLPIARRRVSEVQDRLGRDFVMHAVAE